MMRAIALVWTTIVLSVLTLKEVDGGKLVDEKKLDRWVGKTDNNMKFKKNNLNIKFDESKYNLGNLIEVIQYVIVDAVNTDEFHAFMVKRFLHNYIPQASDFLKRIKTLKMEMDPKAAAADDRIDRAMKLYS